MQATEQAQTQDDEPEDELQPEDAPDQAAAKDRPVLIVEAALFSAGQPISIEQLTEQTRLTTGQVQDALSQLKADYDGRSTALDIIKSGQKWALGLQSEYAEQTRHIVPPEVPRYVVRTLALIAYHQPILQSNLKDLVGSKVYEHVGHLVDAGMVAKTPDGLTYRLSTTEDFPEYFGIPEDEPERIRTFLAEKVGIKLQPLDDPVAEYKPEGDEDEQEPAEDEATAPAEPVSAEGGQTQATLDEDAQEPDGAEAAKAAEDGQPSEDAGIAEGTGGDTEGDDQAPASS